MGGTSTVPAEQTITNTQKGEEAFVAEAALLVSPPEQETKRCRHSDLGVQTKRCRSAGRAEPPARLPVAR